ncbi:MAG: AAA domain-containing protein [Chitinophagaceae bacterium]
MQIGNLRARVVAVDKEYFDVDSAVLNGQALPMKVLVPAAFQSSLQVTAPGNAVALVDVTVEADCLVPKLVIVEPDYLLDVSSVAECMREYGPHPFYFFINRCSPRANTAPILLGNAANFFLDELVYADNPGTVDANATVKKYFQQAPLALASCKDLCERAMELQFFQNLQLHFNHLTNIVQSVFKEKNIDRRSIVLEPSFLCPDLGLQGRLDLLERKEDGRCNVVELKSGKTPYNDSSHQAIGLNHQTQASLYQLMIQEVLKVTFSRLETYICYSRCAMDENPLRLAHPSMALIAQVLDIRNHIVLNDYKVAFKKISPERLFSLVVPERMIMSDWLDSKLVSQYVAPQIDTFAGTFRDAPDLERAYFFAYYRFLVKEQWLSKCGTHNSKERSLSALWSMDSADKIQLGTMLHGLRMMDTQSQYGYTVARFSYTVDYDHVADFRVGDIIVLYEKNTDTDSVANHRVFKGSIAAMNDTEIMLRLRNHQHPQTFQASARYAIEHDVLDINYTAQFQGLYQFLRADPARRDLILCRRKPWTNERPIVWNADCPYVLSVQSLIQKVENARELFLLVGPPGTGKTSIALKSLVDYYYYKETDCCILLTAYTNRAVDEICAAVETIMPTVGYVRLGTHLSCPERYQEKLLGEQLKHCANRREVQQLIARKRIFIGTVASLTANAELLSVKHFELAIVDEASQILDPQLLPLVCAKNEDKKSAIGKFVLIGDERQLPAVCQQESEDFDDVQLRAQGIISGKISFFERMLRYCDGDENLVFLLDKQGRMHPDIAFFSNHFFYGSCLSMVPLPHQVENLYWDAADASIHKKVLAEKRFAYFPVHEKEIAGAKTEATLVADIAKSLWELHLAHDVAFRPQYSLGIITPFRSHIALIRKALRDCAIPELENVVVDTVERYQGSQKDIILYAFGVYHPRQLQQVTDATMVIQGNLVDRKLNVALTRARKQFFFVGSDHWTQQNELYRQLVRYLETGMVE